MPLTGHFSTTINNLLFYASYSTGFKSGGFNSGSGPRVLGPLRIFDQEDVKNYEVGAKTNWFDNALTANIAIYRMDLSGYQDRAFDGVSYTVLNAGSLRHQGVEVDTQLRPLRGLSLNASVAYLDSEFTSYVAAPNLPGVPGVRNATGDRNTFSPKWTGAVGGQYEGSLSNDLSWSIRGDITFTSSSNIGLVNDNSPFTIEKGYEVVSGRLSVHGPDERWTASIFGENLTSTNFCTQKAYHVLGGLLGTVQSPRSGMRCVGATPVTFGASLGVSF